MHFRRRLFFFLFRWRNTHKKNYSQFSSQFKKFICTHRNKSQFVVVSSHKRETIALGKGFVGGAAVKKNLPHSHTHNTFFFRRRPFRRYGAHAHTRTLFKIKSPRDQNALVVNDGKLIQLNYCALATSSSIDFDEAKKRKSTVMI